MRSALLIIFYTFFLFCSFSSFAQGVYRFERADSVMLIENSGSLKNAWAGGLNFVVMGEIDLDYDGIADLVIFDKSGNKVIPFLNQGVAGTVAYRYAPEYRKFFPPMTEWLVFKDYNGDGQADLFTYYSGGTRIYKNIGSASEGLKFEKVVNLLFSDYENINTSIFVPASDLPGIEDIDGDGDLDFLAFDVFGGCVDYHRNLSMELYGHLDSLKFELVTRNWGNFAEDGFTNAVSLNADCGRNLRHAGSSFLLLDVNGDSKKDLVLGDINYNNMVLLINGGTQQTAQMTQVQINFPAQVGGSFPVNTTVFPAGVYMDVNNDGVKDLLVAPTAAGRSDNFKSIWHYQNSGFDSLPSFQLVQKGFLQNTMLDMGEGAHPVFVDFDGDGLQDLVIGNYGYFVSTSNYDSRLRAYRNTGTASAPEFTFFSADFGNLSSANLDGLMPTFGDLDGDGDLDMIVGESNGRLHYYKNNAGAGQIPQFTLEAANFSGIQEPQFSAPFLFDLDEDGKLDLLVGSRAGRLNFYKNNGTALIPMFSSTPTVLNIGGVNTVDQTLSFYGFSTPYVFADANDFQLFCGSFSGRIFHFKGLKGNLNGEWQLVTPVADSLVYEGMRTAVSVADINNDGKLDMVVGNYSGGLSLLYGQIVNTSIQDNSLPAIMAEMFPNPFSDWVSFTIPNNTGKTELTVMDIRGVEMQRIIFSAGESVGFDASALPGGVFVFKIQKEGYAPYVCKGVKMH
ncbi:MAG: T9SS type A sorting domain-containing protein [Flavobacteriales bacterium]|nr:T9SS type A sorting domain-containing protein [Flavobacteriales bacterium]